MQGSSFRKKLCPHNDLQPEDPFYVQRKDIRQ